MQKTSYLHSVLLELGTQSAATVPATTGHLAHALFLDLVKQVDAALATRLHEEPGYRPFTVSPLIGGHVQHGHVALAAGQSCRLRITLLDGGPLWQCLSGRFHQAPAMTLRLGEVQFKLDRLLATPTADATGWAAFTDWQTLSEMPVRRTITLRFASPTVFSLGKREFALFPEPALVWDSLLRTWNSYAPEVLRIEKEALRSFVARQVVIVDQTIRRTTLHFHSHRQQGFLGTCTYRIQQGEQEHMAQLTALAEFARYSGVGSKTTMGMGQVRVESGKEASAGAAA